MINYNCKGVMLILLRKWYIILILMVILGAVSPVIARLSFENVQQNFEKIEQDANTPPLYNVQASYKIDGQYEQCMKVYLACLNDAHFMQEVISEFDVKYMWEDLKELVEFGYSTKEKIFTITVTEAGEEEIEGLVKISTVLLGKYLKGTSLQEVEFEEYDYAKYEVMQENRQVLTLINEPNSMRSYSKIIITAAIFGAVLGCLIVLILDYLKKCKYEEKKNVLS